MFRADTRSAGSSNEPDDVRTSPRCPTLSTWSLIQKRPLGLVFIVQIPSVQYFALAEHHARVKKIHRTPCQIYKDAVSGIRRRSVHCEFALQPDDVSTAHHQLMAHSKPLPDLYYAHCNLWEAVHWHRTSKGHGISRPQ